MSDKKLIVSDYDGTYKKNDVIKGSEILENNDAVNNFINDNNIFMFATGRVFSSFYNEYVINNLFSDFISCANGNVIFNQNFDLIFFKTVKKDFLRSLKRYYKLIDSLNLRNSYGEIDLNSVVELEIVYKDLEAKKIILNYLHSNSIFSYYHDPKNPLTVHIFNNDFDKVDSIYIVSNMNDVNRKNIFTIGDGDNDVKMIKEFNGFSIKSAKSNLKSVSLDSYETVADFINAVKSDQIRRRKIEKNIYDK